MLIGIIKEGKIPPDRRTPFTPLRCQYIKEKLNIDICVQSSKSRCFSDEEYRNIGISVREDLSDCDILFGIKEVPIDALIANKTYLFFSHTIKKQPHNRNLLQAILNNNIRLIDYETIKDKNGKRLIGFGRYAGIVGSYSGLLIYGKKHNLFQLKEAYKCEGIEEVKIELKKIKLSKTKIVITGSGRVAKGAMEILDFAKITKVSPADFLEKNYDYPVYTQLSSLDYYTGNRISKEKIDFYKNPNLFKSDFLKYAKQASLFISCHYWNPKAPKLFKLTDLDKKNFKLNTIADITCDINGSIPTTIRSSTMDNPVYDINQSGLESKAYSKGGISVMAVDNLPAALPKDASLDFDQELLKNVLPYLFKDDGRIEKASITTKCGKLNDPFSYLEDYVC